MEEKLEVIEKNFRDEEIKRMKKKEFKLPFGIKMKTRKAVRKGKVLAIYLRHNRNLEFRIADIFGGLIRLDKYEVNLYETDAIYTYKKWPVVVVFEWRIMPVGGKVEQYKNRVIGGEDDKEVAKTLNITTDGQQTIIRAIEQAEKAEDANKKKGGLSPIMWLLIIGAGGYLLAKIFGVA